MISHYKYEYNSPKRDNRVQKEVALREPLPRFKNGLRADLHVVCHRNVGQSGFEHRKHFLQSSSYCIGIPHCYVRSRLDFRHVPLGLRHLGPVLNPDFWANCHKKL